MANLILSGSTSGSVTLSSPAVSGTTTLTLPTTSGTLIYSDASANLQFNSGYGSVATAYGCRAWVNFNGTGTVAIRASGNVSSITDNGTGDYTVNFTTAMPDANYAIVGTSNTATNTGKVVMYSAGTAPTVSLVRIFNDIASNLTGQDSSIMNIAVFR
jgi:hypothetical protein